MTRTLRPPRYGLDAPPLLVVPVLLIVGSVVQGVLTATPWPLIGAGLIAACGLCGAYAEFRGKFAVWERLLDEVGLRGDETLLDLGCGRGAVLIAAARRLPSGHATGVDLWRRRDQSGNALAATRANTVAAEVAERVELVTADMTALPFDAESVDVVVSSLAVHNTGGPARRSSALAEAVRVLRPGGRLVVVDTARAVRGYQHVLAPDLAAVERRGLGPAMWFGGPWFGCAALTATKPATTPG